MKTYTLEWYNTCDMADILYQDGFRQRLLLDDIRMAAALSEPNYLTQEEGVENGEGEFIPTFQTLEKRHQFSFIATEYMLDALTLLPLHDSVWLTDSNGLKLKCLDVEVTRGEWDGRFCPVVVSFYTHRYFKTKKCRNKTIALPA